MWITESNNTSANNKGNDSIGTATTSMHTFNCGKNILGLYSLLTLYTGLQLVSKNIQ